VPGRVADWRDLLSDALGTTTSLTLLNIPAVSRFYIGLANKVSWRNR